METIGPIGPNIFTTWPFTENKNCRPLVWRKGKVSPEAGRPVRSLPGASRVKTERRGRGRDAEGVELSGLSVWWGTKEGRSE